MLDMLKSEMAVHELLSGNFKRQEQIPSSALMDWALIRFPVNFFLAYARRASTFPSISILDFFCRGSTSSSTSSSGNRKKLSVSHCATVLLVGYANIPS
eukprot:1148073-Pelagomonas_calceolata.AAC.19